MEIILDELKKTLKYHQRQLQDNLNQIQNKDESIAMLKDSNKKHVEAIQQIEGFIKKHDKEV